MIDVTPWTRIVDDVAVPDGDAGDQTYSTTLLAPNFDGNAFQPGGASRIPNGTDTDTTADWTRNDFDGDGLPCCTATADPGEAINTPNAINAAIPGDPVLNEFVANHTGTDTDEFVEVFGDPNTDYSALTIVEIEGDSGSTGLIDDGTFTVGTTNASGYWTTGFQNNLWENGSITLLLVEGYTGSLGTDLDTDDDGVIDVTPWTRIVDDVAVTDGGTGDLTYSATLLAPGFGGNPFTPGGASRIPNGADTDTTGDWTLNDFDGDGLPCCTATADPGEAINTPNAINAAIPGDPVLNEFVANHTGTDTDEFVEVFGDPNTDYSALTIVEIEGDSGSTGLIDDGTFTVGTTNASGYWTTGFQNNLWENGSITLLLVEGYTGSLGTDLDTDDDGVIDVTPWTRIVDDVAVTDGGTGDLTYSATLLAPGFGGNPFTPGGASRIPNGADTDTTGDWTLNDFDGYGLPCCTGTPDPGEAENTPGAVNAAIIGSTDPVLNEFVADHTGTDSEAFVEVFGDPNTDYSTYTVLEIEGDSSGAGVIDAALPITTTDAGGYWVDPEDMENGTITILLVEGFSGSTGTDLDTDNNGTFDATPWTRIVDDVAVPDGDAGDQTYSTTLLAPNFDGDLFQPGGASRIPNGTDTDTINDWVRNDYDGFGFPGFPGSPAVGEAENTPGAVNALITVATDPVGVCNDPATLIHDIQGSGLASTDVGSIREIEGIVTGDFELSTQLSGFFMQEEFADYDGDGTTSEGIFVYNAGVDSVSPGDTVRIRGSVAEYFDFTEINNVVSVTVCTPTGTTSPTPWTLPVASVDDWEWVEGMEITISQTLYASGNFTQARYGEVDLSVGGPLDNPTNVVAPGAPAIALQDLNDRSRIQLDDASTIQNPLPLPPYLGLDNTLRTGDTLPGITGNVSYGFGVYELQPTQPVNFTRVNARIGPPSVGGSLQVAAYNVLNYFTTIDDSGSICGPLGDQGCRGADTLDEFNRQRDKLVTAISTLDADVVGLMEIENYPGDVPTADLVAGLNAATAPGTYAYIATGAVGADAIRQAILYKPAAVTPLGAFAVLDSIVDPLFDDTLNRPMLVQSFVENATGGVFTVGVNHLKSKGSDCDDVGDPDTGDGQGNCNITRTNAAQAIADFLATDPTGSGDGDFLVIGDLNAYAQEDPVTTLEAGGYTDLIEVFEGSGFAAGAYSYNFFSQSGYLDHGLSSPSMTAQVTGAAFWHVNADEPSGLDYNDYNQPLLYSPDEFRSSDHDPVVIGLDLLALPDLQLSKDDGGLAYTTGEVIVYDLTYTNTTLVDATGVMLSETVPANTTFSAADSSPGWVCSPSILPGATCTYAVGLVPGGGGGGTVSFAVLVDNTLLSPTTIANTAEIGGDDPDANPSNNTASDSTAVVLPIVHINDITLVERPNPGSFQIDAIVQVVNQFGRPLAGLNFVGEVTEGPAGTLGVFVRTTHNDGLAFLTVVSSLPMTLEVCAVDVTGPGVTYDASANVETCDRLTVGVRLFLPVLFNK